MLLLAGLPPSPFVSLPSDTGITPRTATQPKSPTFIYYTYLYTLSVFALYFSHLLHEAEARRVGSDGSMSASGSVGSGFNPRRGSKFSFENFQPRG